mmetsp:Transcript_86017/g.170755  ORF Transcript_86017/g.170755 Transcript_86017/m.170755 type:complete len:451 (-) Transcript_86017:88-1440(-)|eukprot:CAMPEP_0172656706 /NCGR_PEP_ID=MMETSP1074-20121228/1543_1 /TAXON_ID=2916 /ORGANISM="Ceratium fusus, Strain PA161109" /LENGTH=450 /DNA_ID=CAMNT_0013471595 /DNA_START=70 /DNA_END=1422 /DNA_ORIENTATION=+
MTSEKKTTALCTVGAGAALVALGAETRAFVTSPAAAGAAPSLHTPGLRATASANQAFEKQPAKVASGMSGALVLGAAAACTVAAAARRRAAIGRARDLDTPRGARVVVAAKGGADKKRVLVMGGTRFIGCYLVAKLRELGHEVVVLNRGKTNEGKPDRLPGTSDADYEKMLEGVTVLKADRKEPEQLKAAVAAAGKFDIVFDNNVRKLDEVQPLVEGILASGGCEQFVLMSSAGVYGPTDVLPLSESNPGDPNSRHKEKLSCENFLAEKGLNWTSIRPVYIYGPMNYNPVERFFFDRVARDRPVCVPYGGQYITQLGHCEDLADFMVKCIGNPTVKGQVYNVSGEDFVTFDGMAKLCAEAAGKPAPKIVHFDIKDVEVPEGFPKAFPFRGMHFFAGIEKAKRDVPDWKPKYSLLEGLKSSYAQDYVARGFDKKDPDFRTDELILEKMAKA